MFRRKFVEKIKTHILGLITFFRSAFVYEIIWKYILQPGRLWMKIECTHIAYRIPKATSTHSDYVILMDFPLQQWLDKRASMLRYTYIVSLVNTWFLIHVNENLHYFSYVIRKPLFPVSFTEINSPLATTAKLSPIKFAIFFTRFCIIILNQFCLWNLCRLFFKAVYSYQNRLYIFILKCFP